VFVIGFNPGHDGAIAAIKDGKLLLCLESEKDTYPRHSPLTPMTVLSAVERLGGRPDVLALGGWQKYTPTPVASLDIAAGYSGAHVTQEREISFLGQDVKLFSSSHVRSHIAMGVGMAPKIDAPLHCVLVWEGAEGRFFLLDENWALVDGINALPCPGGRYALLYGLANPDFGDSGYIPPLDDSGKLMALAAFGDPADADADIIDTVDRFLTPDEYLPGPKGEFRDTPLYNAGVESDVLKIAAALLTQRMFELFASVALERIPKDIPLYISGGCGLNCDWNAMWRELGHFSSVFVPPCTNDSGAALGHAIDALMTLTGEPHIDWDVYCGLEFEWDSQPDSTKWERRALDMTALAEVLAAGHIVAWVQGRYEMGPRALGNRSLLAEPFSPTMHDRLNQVKGREGYRPIAPCCRIEDVAKLFDADFEDPYMLYFRRVISPDLPAVTHVDRSARVQTVTPKDNKPLHDLLSAFAERCGSGILCNTSLNYKGVGFINRTSDLVFYCEMTGIDEFVVDDAWFRRVRS
jgi:hydroxymethyl cephem carbamoyltransferase